MRETYACLATIREIDVALKVLKTAEGNLERTRRTMETMSRNKPTDSGAIAAGPQMKFDCLLEASL